MIHILQLITWLCAILLLMLICYLHSKGQIFTPQFCYVASFLPQAIYAFWYVQKFEIYLHARTMLVLIGGTSLFVFISILTGPLARIRIKKGAHQVKQRKYPRNVHDDSWKLTAFLIFQIGTCVLTVYFLITSYSSASLQQAIYFFRAQRTYGYGPGADFDVVVPPAIRFFKRASIASGPFWAYLLTKAYMYKYKKNKALVIANFALSIVNATISTGGRKDVLISFLTMAILCLLLWLAKYNWKKKIRWRAIMVVVVAVCAISASFKSIGEILGRTINQDAGEYVAVYLAAPLKNLDIYLEKGSFGTNSISHAASMMNVVSLLSQWGIVPPYTSDMFYNRVNGISIGNAYTAYFAYIHDFGYIGLVLFVVLKAMICQWLYQKVRRNQKQNDISILAIVYAYLLSNAIFSFFSDFFIITLLSSTFVWNVLVWCGLKWFISKDIRLYHTKFARRNNETA